MTVQGFDIFEHGLRYEPSQDHASEEARRHFWAVAIGLQDVDGLSVSPFLREVAATHVAGENGLKETGELIRSHHESNPGQDARDADLVAHRIVELLASSPFFLSPDMLVQTHRYLFQDMDASLYHPGDFKSERMVKQEGILNGDSVLYADPLTYEMSLRGAFDAELEKSYRRLEGDELEGFCHFIAFLWQIHPFHEGNTRTIAVFSELYLDHLGFRVENEPFENHARYYRDALVRAMYRNANAEIFPDESFLVEFYENVIGRRSSEFDRSELLCTALFENPSLIRNVNPQEALDKRNL